MVVVVVVSSDDGGGGGGRRGGITRRIGKPCGSRKIEGQSTSP